MCLLLISYETHSEYKLIVAANRDEFYKRPALPASFWENDNNILAGKDILGGGTWLGITKAGRFTAITNYRDMSENKPDAPSRGDLTKDFLSTNISPESYGEKILQNAADYNGYNLIFGDANGMFYFSNKSLNLVKLIPGIYGLSNHLLDTPWPKVKTSKTSFKKILAGKNITPKDLFAVLSDTSIPSDDSLPDTGLSPEIERAVSPVFVETDYYGTRSSTVILWNKRNEIKFIEKSLVFPDQKWLTLSYDFKVSG